MSLSRNFLAALTNSAWTALVGLAVIPFYLKYLGIEAYGLIGFYVTLQALLQLLDMGLAPTINREVARCSVSENLQEAGKLLHTLAVIYWAMAVFIALLTMLLAPLISEYWLQPKELSPQTISDAVMLMGFVIASRWPIGLYQGAIIGAQRLTVSSGINIVMVTASSLGALAVLEFVSPTIEAFFVWQAGVGLVYAATIRWAAWRIIGRSNQNRFDVDKLKNVWRFTVGMSGVTILGLVLNQLDKVILSKILSLESFAHYMIAIVVVSGLFVIISPTFNVIYPRFTELVAKDEIGKLIDLYRMGTRALATILFSLAMLLAVFSEDFVYIWTGNLYVASNVAPIISLLAIGTALHGVMYFPYALQLAYGMMRLPLMICSILVIVMIPMVIFFANRYQAIGGAIAWLILNVLYMTLGIWLTHRHLLKGVGKKWLTQDVGVPLLLSFLVGLVAHYSIQEMVHSVFLKLLLGFLLALSSLLLSFLLSSQLRGLAIRMVWYRARKI